jgi:hypothetical protein
LKAFFVSIGQLSQIFFLYNVAALLRELSGAYDGKAPVPDYLEATVYSKGGCQTLYFTLYSFLIV